jgi:hypothetical protein
MQLIITNKFKRLLILMVMFMLTNQLIKAQCSFRQLGLDIDGETDSDYSGNAVSLSADGITVAIGARLNSGVGGCYVGHVRVYKNINGTWIQQGADIDGETNDNQFGACVSLSADGLIVAIGAPGNSDSGSRSGQVSVFKNINGTWVQQGTDIAGRSNDEELGSSVTLSADGLTLATGAPQKYAVANKRGLVRVYKYISNNWIQQGVDIEGENVHDEFGYSISLSDDGLILAIGAPANFGGGYQRGHVRVYKNINGSWTQLGADIDGEAADDRSGTSVNISGDGSTVAIGAPRNSGEGYERGHVRVYKNFSGVWFQIGADINGEADRDASGNSVSLSYDGLLIAIGASSNSEGGYQRGHVRIYQNDNNVWTQNGADIDGEAANDESGYSVSISADGLTIAIGAPSNYGGGFVRGQVRVYGCVPASSLSKFNRETVGLVYPNPFNETLILSLNLQEDESCDLSIINTMGQVVYNSFIDKPNTTLNLEALNIGLYTLCITSNKHQQSFKISKE